MRSPPTREYNYSMVTRTGILERAIEPTRDALSSELAQYILKLDFPPEDHARYRELAARAHDGALSSDEQTELDDYLSVNTLLTIMQSTARVSLAGGAANR